MEYPKIEILNKSIVHWIEENFVKAVMPFHVMKQEFKFAMVTRISRVWKENDYWVVDASFEYGLRTAQSQTITFQVNGEGKIIGYRVHRPNEI